MSTTKPWTTARLCDAIAFTHAPPGWSVFFEVANATGWSANRSADAIAMSLWPSRGLILRGFEIKVTRGDLKRELAKPEKAERIAAYCDEWWLVAPPGMVDLAELPPAWGLMEPTGRLGVHCVRSAVRRDDAKPLDRRFLAAVLRRAHERIQHVEQKHIRLEDIEERVELAREAGKREVPLEIERVNAAYNQIKNALDSFKTASGIDLLDWQAGGAENLGRYVAIGRAIDARYNAGVNGLPANLRNSARQLDIAAAEIEEALKP